MEWIPYIEIRSNTTREIIGIIEGAELEFNYSFNESGDFEVYCRSTENNVDLLKKDNYITLPVAVTSKPTIEENSNMWVIQKIQKTNDATGGRWIIATGKEAKQIVDKRIIRNTAKLDKNADVATEVRTKLFAPNLLTPTDTKRPITGFVFTENTVGVSITEDTQVTYENLFTYTEELYKAYGVGARLRLDRNTNNMIYTIYKGTDRSNEIVFSQGNDNLLNSDYVEDWTAYKTSALIGGEEKEESETNSETGETRKYTKRTMIMLEDGSKDIERSEVFVDAKDLQSTYNEEVDGETQERTYTDSVYQQMLRARGREKLASENNVIREFNGEIDTVNNRYKFNVDYYLGDLIKIRDDDLQKEITVRVSKFTKVQNDEGYKEYFEYEELTTTESEAVEGALLTEYNENLLTENNNVLLVEEVPTTYSTRSVSSTSTTSTGGVRISELPEATNINEDCCLPIVSEYETKRITYGSLKERLSNDLDLSGETYDDTEIRNEIEEVRSSIPSTDGLASEEFVETKIADLVNSAPETLDTLGELATAIENNADVVETLNAAITNKVDKVDGKGLSTNDYTNEDKSKLAGLSNYDDTELANKVSQNESAITDLQNNKANDTDVVHTTDIKPNGNSYDFATSNTNGNVFFGLNQNGDNPVSIYNFGDSTGTTGSTKGFIKAGQLRVGEEIRANDVIAYETIKAGTSITKNNVEVATLNDLPTDYVSINAQSLTEEQKAQARENIGAGSGSFSGSYKDLINKPYDAIITTQTEFETLIASSDWLGAKSVAFIGDGGNLVFEVSDTITIPQTVMQIQGFNNAIIKITPTSSYYGMWYSTKPTGSGYSINDLKIIISGGTYAYGLARAINITKVYVQDEETSSTYERVGFLSCDKVIDCTAVVPTYGFSCCSYGINNTGTDISCTMWFNEDFKQKVDDTATALTNKAETDGSNIEKENFRSNLGFGDFVDSPLSLTTSRPTTTTTIDLGEYLDNEDESKEFLLLLSITGSVNKAQYGRAYTKTDLATGIDGNENFIIMGGEYGSGAQLEFMNTHILPIKRYLYYKTTQLSGLHIRATGYWRIK